MCFLLIETVLPNSTRCADDIEERSAHLGMNGTVASKLQQNSEMRDLNLSCRKALIIKKAKMSELIL